MLIILCSKSFCSQEPVVHAYHPSYSGGRDQEEASTGQIDHESLSQKYPTQEKSGGVAQVEEGLLSEHKALSLNSSAATHTQNPSVDFHDTMLSELSFILSENSFSILNGQGEIKQDNE
jgi:hypothetical protein